MKALILLILFPVWALGAEILRLTSVDLECTGGELCEQRRVRYQNLIGEYRSLVHVKDTIRIMASDGGYRSFWYELAKTEDEYRLQLKVQLKPLVKEINVGFTDRSLPVDPSQLLTLKEGDFFDPQRLKDEAAALSGRLEVMGYPQNESSMKVTESAGSVRIDLIITLGKPRVFKKMKTNATSPFVDEFLRKKFLTFYNKPFEITRFKLYLDEAQKDLFSYGYYLIGLEFNAIVKKNRVILDVKVSNDKLYAFDFLVLKEEQRSGLLEVTRDLFRKYKRPLTEAIVRSAFEDHYAKKALLRVKVNVETSRYTNRYKEQVTLYRIRLQENEKTRVTSVAFIGNVFFSARELQRLYQNDAFELASIHFYDADYLEYFAGKLKQKYIEKGYVQARIIGPTPSFSEDRKQVNVEYNIIEGARAFVKEITFDGIPDDFQETIRAKLENKAGAPFNPVKLTEDLKEVSDLLQEQGYYFAEVVNVNDDNLVTYNKTGSDVSIHFIVNPGPLVRLNRIIYIGNTKTNKRVLQKKLLIDKGDLVTPSKTRDFEAAISATGLFNSVSVTPLRHSSKSTSTDLLVKVTERDYGLVEFAPGYRTDIGLKLTSTVSYLNIGGMNRAITLQSQVNQRINYQTFDPVRRAKRQQLLEHNTTLTYTQGDIFSTLIDTTNSLSYQRKRFYSFDADIARYNTTFTRDLTKRFSTSMRYQLEKISQFNATQEKDNGSFQIGAITPSLTYDLRNSQVNPLKGAFFNLSCEFANPYFLSQKNSDLTVNYYKLISRNRFYIPFKGGTVAISMVGGVQENLAKDIVRDANGNPVLTSDGQKQTNGYIPNIKVFRLTGMDIVRGFTDQEINRTIQNQDVGTARIQNKAYLANFKLEPRYFINDTFMAGVFLDAGRVYVDQVDFGQLRTSAGITFKILTPVGTLDLDYGFKLQRQRLGPEGGNKLEDPGRFHVSIGFF